MPFQNRTSALPDQATVEPGARFGAWTALRADPTGKRVTCVCSCGTARQVALEALQSGESVGCGCAVTPRPRAALNRPSYSADLARLEGRAATKWHKGGERSL